MPMKNMLFSGYETPINQISISAYGESKIPEKIYSTIMPFEEHFKDSCIFVEISKNID